MAKYSASLVKEFIAELEKVPMIRQACSKIGLDHSTVYRWMTKHPDLYTKVHMALNIGRRNVTDAAESVIVQGIQNSDRKSAEFWLTHNDQRYMKPKQGEYFGILMSHLLKKMEEHEADKTQMRFDQLFKLYDYVEQNYSEPEIIKHWVDPFIEVYCDNDPKLMEVFRRAYAEWKKDKQTYESSIRRAGMELDEDGVPFDPRQEQKSSG